MGGYASDNRCPHCKRPLSRYSDSCPNCRYRFDESFKNVLFDQFKINEQNEASGDFKDKEISIKCPHCRREIMEFADSCAYCGFQFKDIFRERLIAFINAKEVARDLRHLRNLSDCLSEGVAKLTAKLATYEEATAKAASDGRVRDRKETPNEVFTEPFNEAPADALKTDISFDIQRDAGTTLPTVSNQAQSTTGYEFSSVNSKPDMQATAGGGNLTSRDASGQSDDEKGGHAFYSKPKSLFGFELQLGQIGLLASGIVIMIIGVGFFLKYSIERGWISPALRVAMVYAWGGAFLYIGDRLRKRNYRTFGLYLTGAGIAALYFASYAGYGLYAIINQPISFVLLVLVTAMSCTFSIMYDAKALAILGAFGGFLTPVMLSTGVDRQFGLMTYVILLDAGIFAITFFKRWIFLQALGFAGTYIMFAGWYAKFYNDEKFLASIIFLHIFFLFYSVIPYGIRIMAGMSTGAENIDDMTISRYVSFEAIITALNSVVVIIYGYLMIKGAFEVEWVSALTLSHAVFYLYFADVLIKRREGAIDPINLFLGHVLFYLIVTVPIVFSNKWMTIFWLAQGAAFLWIGSKTSASILRWVGYALVIAMACKFVFIDLGAVYGFEKGFYFEHGYGHLIISRCSAEVLIAAALIWAAKISRDNRDVKGEVDWLSALLKWSAVAFIFVALNVEDAAFFHKNVVSARLASISVIWSAFAVALMILGFRFASSSFRKASMVFFAATSVKVILVDMSNISTPYRIMSFVILGLLLILSSYLYHKFKDKLLAGSEMSGTDKETL